MIIALSSVGAWYLFCLGLATGLAVLAMSAYIAVTPRWLRALLFGCGLLMVARYLTMALLALLIMPPHPSLLHRLWFGSAIGLTFPTLVALDQLVRHPAITPRTLLRWYAPFFGVVLLAVLFGHIELLTDPLVGIRPKLMGIGRWVFMLAEAGFALGVLSVCGLLWRRLASLPIRMALAGLALAYLALATDGLLVAGGWWYVRPFLFSEMLTLAALWAAFQLARLNQ